MTVNSAAQPMACFAHEAPLPGLHNYFWAAEDGAKDAND